MDWKEKEIKTLRNSLLPVPVELNELDWKSGLSSKTERLDQHISAFANLEGGGIFVFGVFKYSANFGDLDKERWQGMLTYISDGTYLQLCHIIVPGKRERNCKAVPSEKNKLSSDSASKREKKTKSFCHSERSEESHRNKVLLSF